MAKREAIICDGCGVPMNHHAEKLVEPRDSDDAARAIAGMGGWIEEVHQCPGCGNVAARAGL